MSWDVGGVLGAGRDSQYSGARRGIGASGGIWAPRGVGAIMGVRGVLGGPEGV